MKKTLRLIAFLAASHGLLTTFVHATDFTWGGGTGSWTDSNWNPGPVTGPTSNSDTAIIGTGTVIVNVNNLGVGNVSMSGGTLQAGVSFDTVLGSNIQINGTGNVISAPTLYNFTLSGNLTGSGTASVAGEWAVGLGGDNSGFTGTWITGDLGSNNLTRFDTANSGSASAAWVLNNGRMVNGNGSSPIISLGSLSGTGGILSNNASGQVTYSIGALNTDTTFSGLIVNEWGGGGTTAITKVGSGTLTLSGGLSYTGATVINGGNLVIQTGLNYATPSTSSYTLNNNAKLTFYSTNNPMIDKAITGSGNLYIDGTGAGDQYQNRVNIMSDGLKTFSGSVNVLANGKLAVWGGNGSGAIPDASVVDVAGLVTFYGNSETIGGLTGSGVVQGHNGVLTVANGADQTFSGTLRNNPNEAGSFGLTKTGSGTLTLGGTNTFTGATTVSAGTLLVTGALGNSAVSVNGGAFGGTGTVGSSLTINNGGFFHVADLFDPLAVTGTITLFSGFGVDDLAGLDWGSVADGTYTLIDGTLGAGVFTGLANNSLATAYNLGGGRSAYFQEGSLQLVVIPEPHAALLGGLGMLALLRRRRG